MPPPPLPLSRTAIDKLSHRLRHTNVVAPEDLNMLEQVLGAYQVAGGLTAGRLWEIGFSASSRTKSTSVLIDKLKRDNANIGRVRDLAGCRIICAGGRGEQDDIVQHIVESFSDGRKPPHVIDRRIDDSHGYRAVHVVVTVEDLPVEIQVRTTLQHLWAQTVEILGDVWGRGIRYGEAPPDEHLPVTRSLTRRQLWDSIQAMGKVADAVERSVESLALIDRLGGFGAVATEDAEAQAWLRKQDEASFKRQVALAEGELAKQLYELAEIAKGLRT